jgi:hypothetical protein
MTALCEPGRAIGFQSRTVSPDGGRSGCDLGCRQIVRDWDKKAKLFTFREARDVTTPPSVLNQCDASRCEAADLAIAGFVFNGAAKCDSELSFRCSMEVKYT